MPSLSNLLRNVRSGKPKKNQALPTPPKMVTRFLMSMCFLNMVTSLLFDGRKQDADRSGYLARNLTLKCSPGVCVPCSDKKSQPLSSVGFIARETEKDRASCFCFFSIL